MTTVDASTLNAVIFDFDGVLTDNRVLVLEDGREAVFCNRADGLAFDFLHRVGMPVHILSTEANPVVRARAAKLQVDVRTGIRDKVEAVASLCEENGYAAECVLFVGNDVNDLPAMRLVGYPVAVADAHEAVRRAAWRVLATPGGGGVAREIVEQVIGFDESLY